MNFIKSLFKVFLTLGLYFIIIVIATAIMYFGIDKLRWFWLLHPTIITQGILIGKIIYRHHSNLSTNLAFLGVFASIIALVINHQYINIFVYMKNWPILGTGSILFSIAFAYAFSIENYEHWKMFLLNKINPIQKRVKDDGIPLGKEMIEKSKPIQGKLKKYISELGFNKPTIIKTALLIMLFDYLIYPPYRNAKGDYEMGHWFIWEQINLRYITVDYKTLFIEYILIGIIALGLIYLKSLKDERKTN